MARLVYEHLGASHECEIVDDGLIVGRAVDADLTIQSKAFSRKHFRIFRDGLLYYVEDLGSSNGTRLEAERLDDVPAPLVNGARVVAGGIAFVFDDGAGLGQKKKRRMASTRTKRIVVAPKLSSTAQLPKITMYPLDGGAPQEFEIRSALTIGRKDGNDLVIKEKVVSGKHCTFQSRDGALVLTDHGSSNGTFVNGAGITQAMLKHGDIVTLGKQLKLVVSDPSSSNEIASQDRARLVFQEEEGRPAQDAFIAGSLSVGRESDNQLVIIDPVVSAHHCVIDEREDGFFLSDLGSGNGTSVAGEEVTTDFPLVNGDVITLGGEVQLFFINPETSSPIEEAAQPARSRKPKGPKPQKSGRAAAVSEDVLEAGEESKDASLSAGAAKAGFALSMVVSIAVAITLVAAGFIVPSMMGGDGEAVRASDDEPQHPSMSFEAEGSLGGWKVESSNPVKMGLDTQWVYDGKQALVLSSEQTAQSIRLTSLQSVPIDLQGAVEYSLALEGNARPFRVLLSLLEKGNRYVIGSKEVQNLSTGSWGDHRIPCKLFNLVGDARLCIEIMNFQGSLRLDGIRMVSDQTRPLSPMPLLSVGDYTIENPNPGSFYLTTPDNSKACWIDIDLCDASGRLLPRRFVVDEMRNDLRSSSLKFQQVEPDASTTKASLRAMSLEVSHAQAKSGLELHCETLSTQRGRRPVLTFSVETGAVFDELELFDAYGNRIPLKADAHAFGPIRDVVEISAGDLHIAIIGKSALELRPATAEGNPQQLIAYAWQTQLSLHLNPLSQSRVRLYEKVLKRIDSLAFDRQMSSAVDHANFLARLDRPEYKSFVSQAKAKLTEFESTLNELWLDADSAMRVAHGDRNLEMAQQALQTLEQIGKEFPQDARASQAKYFSEEIKQLIEALKKWQSTDVKGFRVRRPPAPSSLEVIAEDNQEAATFLGIALRDHRDGNWLRAYLFADNIVWNYHYTKSAEDAKQLADEIQAAWDDQPTRDDWVQAKLGEATGFERGAAPDEALAQYREILARYPYCPESKEVLRKVRELEAIGG